MTGRLSLGFMLALMLSMSSVEALAAPANPDLIELQQDDGSRFKAVVRGDEFQGWVETEDGYSVAKDEKTKNWEYAYEAADGGFTPSGIKVDRSKGAPKGFRQHIKPKRNRELEDSLKRALSDVRLQAVPGASASSLDAQGTSLLVPGYPSTYWNPYPVSGNKKLLVVLVNFANRALTTTASSWGTSIFNQTAGAKSTLKFFEDNSFGSMHVVPVTHTQSGNPAGVVTVTLATNHPDYAGGITSAVETPWVTDALTRASAYVDFSALDTNGNGILENSEVVVYLIPAGYEAAVTVRRPSIWAHAMSSNGLTVDGVQLKRWAINGELDNGSAQTGIGVMTHELGHSMCGLPDLYDINGVNRGMGVFSTMAQGCWGRLYFDNSPGSTPVSFDAWCRQYLGWSVPRVPASAGQLVFGPALGSSTSTVKLTRPDIRTTEYFLAENRYCTGWDQGLEAYIGQNFGGGLLLQHIDITVGYSTNDGFPTYNDLNAYVSGGHQGVMVEEASTVGGSLVGNTSNGLVTHMFYNGNNAEFGQSTTPNTSFYDGVPTGLRLYGVSASAQNMTANVSSASLYSAITSPSDGATLNGTNATVSGTAFTETGTVQYVDVSTDGGTTWARATGTSPWSYNWLLPPSGSVNLKSRLTNSSGGVEVPGAGIKVTVTRFGNPELAHYNWSIAATQCADCHVSTSKFLVAGYRRTETFCGSCHNSSGKGHEKSLVIKGHSLKNYTSGGCRMPVYGNITAGEYNNQPFSRLVSGKVACVTCHNPMRKSEDYGRAWEYTTTADRLTYSLQRGGWTAYGHLKPVVYRDASLWSGPAFSKSRKTYLVDPSEYNYDEGAGTVVFKTAQPSTAYIYATLDYPYLRASSQDNRLCVDCHTQVTHKGANCLTCHTAHNTGNKAGIREKVRTTDMSDRAVVFSRMSGAASFTDGDAVYNGVCEVCHTQTLYYKRDGSGAALHADGKNYNGKDCTACHTHASGFAK